jgi:hypothetical protein
MFVVNLFAGPSVGKSTLAPDIFTKLKRLGIQAECPPEVAKLHAQRGDMEFLRDQLAVFGQTQHQLSMSRLSGSPIAVSDSPILLSLVYAPKPYFASFPNMVREVAAQYQNLNYYLKRDPSIPFSEVGRVHNEAESKEKDAEILEMLRTEQQTFKVIDSSEESARIVVADVVKALRLSAEAANANLANPTRQARMR